MDKKLNWKLSIEDRRRKALISFVPYVTNA